MPKTKEQTKQYNKWYRETHKVKKPCLYCKKIHEMSSKRRKFCSSQCSGKYYSGKNNPRWKGGIRKDKDGYILILRLKHPNVNCTGYMSEHRLVMEKKIGRYLKNKEIVHHLNGIKYDNRIENLALCTGKTHANFIKILQKRIKELEDKLENIN